ncbi:homeobox-leucine zipper protein HAT4-like isoform X2 [Trifolium pratense]|uniref:homeobox-leucine zipper protein HAT4-like isoform X2 n=1 Tax=Trifolium pratense TaxID=57577 RepID=UPI001E6962E1|nr:homeobox-leucine zipper protein HAT4-like isoform X2 [Trifolium pratense]
MIELTHHSLPIFFSFLSTFLFNPFSHASFHSQTNLSPFKTNFPFSSFSFQKSVCFVSYTIEIMIMVEKEDLGLSLSLNLFQNTPKQPQPLNLISSSPYFHPLKLSSQQTITPSDQNSKLGIDVNRLPCTVVECEEEEAGVSSPNSTVSSVSGKRSLRELDHDVDNRGNISDEEDAETARKKLRLSKDQSLILEETFKEHNTLNPKQKLALAKQLGLRPRQVEVWFQNRRARTKLKQTEVDCEVLKRCCENLTEENRRLQKEVQELRALKLSPQFYMQMTPPTTLTMCPSCERVAVPSSGVGVDASNRHISMAQAHHRALPIGPWASVAPITHRMFDVFRQ